MIGEQTSEDKWKRDPSEPVFASDGPLIGSKSILSSPNVVEPSYTHAMAKPLPIPSVYADARGEIHNILVGDTRINVLHTKGGVMRSGDIHPNTQCDFVFNGSVEVWIAQGDGTTKKTKFGARDYIEVPPYTPHVFHFLEDTIIAEWWEGRDGSKSAEFRQWFYAPYRRIVDTSYNWGAPGPRGMLRVFRETEQKKVTESDNSDEKEKNRRTLYYTIAAVGLFLGIWVGRRKK